MSEYDFQQKVLHDLGEIQGTQKFMYDDMRTQQADIKEFTAIAAEAKQSAKSAHHRINLIMALLGTMGSALLYVVIKSIWP